MISSGTESAGILILYFWPPALRNKLLLFKPQSAILCYGCSSRLRQQEKSQKGGNAMSEPPATRPWAISIQRPGACPPGLTLSSLHSCTEPHTQLGVGSERQGSLWGPESKQHLYPAPCRHCRRSDAPERKGQAQTVAGAAERGLARGGLPGPAGRRAPFILWHWIRIPGRLAGRGRNCPEGLSPGFPVSLVEQCSEEIKSGH